ncbi:MAG: alpha/beta hydrolase [Ilumatobacteraceae bacterium]
MKRVLATIVAAIGALLSVLSGAVLLRRRRLLRQVAPELRSPLVALPTSITHRLALRIARRLVAVRTTACDGVEHHDEFAPGGAEHPAVRVVVYEPAGRTRPTGALLWIHGGGLVMGSPEQYHDVCSRFAAEVGIVVASVDYRLAPEHPFPAGLDDCMAALRWLHDDADRLGIDVTRVAVGGDSAGGGLAAALAQRAHDEDGPTVCFQLLQYPMLDDRTALEKGRRTLVWSNRSNGYAWSAYLGHRVASDEPRAYASPARRHDLSGLPPAWVGIGDIDLFRDEAVDYATRLRAAGVECDLHVVPGMYHGAERVVPSAPSMVEFMQRMVDAVGRAVR